ncbi:hypothetical protein KC19_4G102600, partial [Ceratodon purpureus]
NESDCSADNQVVKKSEKCLIRIAVPRFLYGSRCRIYKYSAHSLTFTILTSSLNLCNSALDLFFSICFADENSRVEGGSERRLCTYQMLVEMGSTSAGRPIGIDGVDAMSENSNFDLNQASTHFALRRNVLTLFEYVEVPECNEPTAPTSPTDLFQITENEEPISANSVPMQLLNQDEQERDDLLLVYPKAKVEGNYITALHYIVIVKLFLYKLKLSQNRIEGVPHPRAIARLLCRLSRELKSAPSFEPDTRLNRFLDPADYDGCLGEMLKDMEEYINTVDTPSLSDGYVYVRRGTDTYAQSLLAAADELNSSTSR